MLPDPGFLYPSKKHQTALTLLEYGLFNQAGFSVISGETGAGKTTLLRKLLSNIEDDVTVGMIANTHKSFGELLDWVLAAFGIHQPGMTKVEMHQRFLDFLMEQYAQNKTVLLIVDEAQNLEASTLEELRMLSNVNSEKDQLLQVILAGQPELKETLKQPELMQFAQRISVDFHLDALNLKETYGYIQHRLVTAGAERDVFTPSACTRIYEYSGGIPRLINLLCDTVMVYGFADQREMIDEDLVDEMVTERMQNSVVPIFKNIDISNSRQKPVSTAEEIDFPWIRASGGTQGLKPAVEDKTTTNAASASFESEQFADAQPGDPARQEVEVRDVAQRKNDVRIQRPNVIEVVSPREIRQSNYRMIWGIAAVFLVMLIVTALLINGETRNRSGDGASVSSGEQDGSGVAASPEEAQKKLAEAEKIRKEELSIKRLEAERLQQLEKKAETLQRERDEAIAKANAEQKKRAEEAVAAAKVAAAAAAKASAARERKAIAEARAATKREKKALAAAKVAEKKAEEARLLAQRIMELERLRLAEEERRRAELAAQKKDLALQGANFFEISPDAAETKNAPVKKESDTDKFSVDPCSRPTAKFLSTCR